MDRRGVTPVIGVIMMVGVAVILGAIVTGYAYGIGGESQSPAPGVSVSNEVVERPSDGAPLVAVTLDAGEAVEIDRLYVSASEPFDIGDRDSAGTSGGVFGTQEAFAESASGPPQVDIGDTWDSGETVYLAIDTDGDGNADDPDGVTVRIYWNTEPVEGVNPGTVSGEDAYRIVEFVV